MEDITKNIYRYSPQIAWQQERSRGFIYISDMITHRQFYLENVAKDCWLLINGVHSLKDVIDQLAIDYNAPYEMIKTDTIQLINDLVKNHLVERVN